MAIPIIPSEKLKECKYCNTVKPLSKFPSKGNGYYKSKCKECLRLSYYTKPHKPYVSNKPYRDSTTGGLMKKCGKCHMVKLIEYFSKREVRISAICKTCANPKTKICNVCHIEQDISQFPIAAGYPSYRCRSCINKWERNRRSSNYFFRFHSDSSGNVVKTCPRCGVEKAESSFLAANGRRYCYCRPCRAALRRERDALRPDRATKTRQRSYQKNITRRRADAIVSVQRRRALIANASIVEEIDRQAIIERDNSTCYLCHTKLPTEKVALDHVVPLSRGGDHSAANLKVACKSCNSKKKDKLLSELMQL